MATARTGMCFAAACSQQFIAILPELRTINIEPKECIDERQCKALRPLSIRFSAGSSRTGSIVTVTERVPHGLNPAV